MSQCREMPSIQLSFAVCIRCCFDVDYDVKTTSNVFVPAELPPAVGMMVLTPEGGTAVAGVVVVMVVVVAEWK